MQLPEHERGQVLVRTDSGGCSKAFLHHITDAGLEYSIPMARGCPYRVPESYDELRRCGAVTRVRLASGKEAWGR
jgi:hypothetical protein